MAGVKGVMGLAGTATSIWFVARRILRARQERSADLGRWRVVTIYRPMAEVSPEGQLPAPLAALGDAIEVDIRPAPRDEGTEVAARLIRTEGLPPDVGEQSASADPRARLRRALREVKQLVEVGEVLQSKPRPEGARPATPTGKLVDAAEQKVDRGGVL